MIVGTAGHIDHGKTSLVRRLTGIDTDRLKEEKARGISIDLGFAYLPRPGGRIIGFVDVPGHEGLVHNMLAGATGIDFVVLVVAADDGVMPQTREHLAIVDLLGLTRGLVALTKCDLVPPERVAAATDEVRLALAGTGLAAAEVVPVSAVTGTGLDVLQEKLDAAAASTPDRAATGAFRLAVDRCFTLAGRGTVVTGTVMSGRVAVDDAVIVSPAGLEARVRSIHAQDRPAQEGVAGDRCALLLAGPEISKDSVRRGSVVLAPELHAPATRIDVRMKLLASETRPLRAWTPVRVHHAAAEVGGRIVPLSEDALAPGSLGLAQIVLEHAIAAGAGDRFVIRDTTSSRTIGGGTFLDIRAPERRRRTPERMAELAALEIGGIEATLAALLASASGHVALANFCRDHALPRSRAAELISELDLVALGGASEIVMSKEQWARFSASAGAALDAFHAADPDLPGMSMEKLRLAATPRLPPAVLPAGLQRLVKDGAAAIDRAWIRRPGHEVRFSAEDERLWARVLPLIADVDRFRPPRVRDIAKELTADAQAVRRRSRLAARRGDVEEVAHDHYFLYDTVAEMAGIARELAAADTRGFTVIAFRDKLDNGRKVAIQILEFFDRHGFTMRRGDWRRINPHRAGLFAPRANDTPVGAGNENGGVPLPVGRPDFKSGWGRQTVPGGFDSHPPPPPSTTNAKGVPS